MPLATVRAGNVVGGGDWADDRLIPDAVGRSSAGRPLVSCGVPDAVRPWQHVLDALFRPSACGATHRRSPGRARRLEFGPPAGRTMTVGEVVALAASAWGKGARVAHDGVQAYPETEPLTLDSQRIRTELGYAESWDLPQIIARTMAWYREALAGADAWALHGTRSMIMWPRPLWLPGENRSRGRNQSCPQVSRRAASVATSSRIFWLRRHAAGQ